MWPCICVTLSNVHVFASLSLFYLTWSLRLLIKPMKTESDGMNRTKKKKKQTQACRHSFAMASRYFHNAYHFFVSANATSEQRLQTLLSTKTSLFPFVRIFDFKNIVNFHFGLKFHFFFSPTEWFPPFHWLKRTKKKKNFRSMDRFM